MKMRKLGQNGPEVSAIGLGCMGMSEFYFTGDNLAKNLQVVDKVNELARRHGCSSAQLALAWVLSRRPQIVPIPGTTNIGRLEENIDATQIELSPQELAEIDAISPKGVAAGDRYPEFAMALQNG